MKKPGAKCPAMKDITIKSFFLPAAKAAKLNFPGASFSLILRSKMNRIGVSENFNGVV
jgi:hypothetical protein